MVNLSFKNALSGQCILDSFIHYRSKNNYAAISFQIYQSHVDEFLGKSFLTCCLVSVLLKPGEKAENFLRYSVVIENILPETELFIHCSLNQFSTGEITIPTCVLF